jgi:hypothetical protein
MPIYREVPLRARRIHSRLTHHSNAEDLAFTVDLGDWVRVGQSR